MNMKTAIIKSVCVIALLATISSNVSAQRTPKRRTNTPTTNTGGTNGGGTETQNTNNTNTPAYNPTVNVPITFDTSSNVNGVVMPSLRNDNAFDKSGITTRIPLPYEHLRWDDALYAEKVWRELELKEKTNQVFRYDGQEGSSSQLFINILFNAIEKDGITAFSDDRFTTPLTREALALQTAGGFDTVDRYSIDDISKIEARVVTRREFDPKSVTKLRIKEEWVFDRESSRMFCRILGISPVLTRYNENGSVRGTQPMFWIYYPELRATLAKYEVYNPKNMGQSRMTWEELFESRMFSSYILKSTIDNAANKNIRQYIKDPILALLEGDNIKEKIFNFEQDLWSY
ncbi:MAG: gliding motility protein GldN [Bacteroidota bacterium]|jgi:gliding motility associated protien GldN